MLSANLLRVPLIPLSRWSIKTLKITCPSAEPWETSLVTSHQLNVTPFLLPALPEPVVEFQSAPYVCVDPIDVAFPFAFCSLSSRSGYVLPRKQLVLLLKSEAQLSWTPLPLRTTSPSQGTLSVRFLKKPKSAFLKPKVAVLPTTLFTSPGIVLHYFVIAVHKQQVHRLPSLVVSHGLCQEVLFLTLQAHPGLLCLCRIISYRHLVNWSSPWEQEEVMVMLLTAAIEYFVCLSILVGVL